MPQPSVISLVGILQRHGLTYELLELFVHHCEGRHNGGVTFHTVGGTITSYEIHASGRVATIQRELAKELTKTS